MSRNPVRVGIVGLGRSGWNLHFNALKNMQQFAITAVVDPIAERRKEAIEAVGCTAYAEVGDLFNDERVELVVVATPSHTHAELACRALEAGKHVIVEKPMAGNLAEVDRMIETSKAAQKLLTVFQSRRLDADFVRVKEIVQSGILGPIVLVRLARHWYQRRNDWNTLRRYGGGQLNNWGTHIVDHGLQLIGTPVGSIFADMQQTVSAGDAEDHFKITFKAANGAVADIEVTNSAAFAQPEYFVMGKYGSLRGSTKRIEYKYYDPTQVPKLEVVEVAVAGRSYGSADPIPWVEKEEEIQSVNTSVLFYEMMYDTIRENKPLFVTPESVRDLMEVLEKARELNPDHGR